MKHWKTIILAASLALLAAIPSHAQTPVTVVIDGRSYSLTLVPLDGGVGPNAPDTLGVERDALGRVVVTWADKSSDETGFRLWRRTTGSGQWAKIATTAANINAYTDHGALAGNSYVYRVQAEKETGASAFTPEVSFSVASTPVPAVHPTAYAHTTPDGGELTTIAPGDTIAIRGDGFGEGGQVLVNYLAVPHRIWSDTAITVRLPDWLGMLHPPTITVRRADGKSCTSMLAWSQVGK